MRRRARLRRSDRVEHDPYLNDPDRWGTSLAQVAEIMLPCLEAAGARSVVEVGAFAGDLTRVLVDWADTYGARVGAIDPSPQESPQQVKRPRHQHTRQTSQSGDDRELVWPPPAVFPCRR